MDTVIYETCGVVYEAIGKGMREKCYQNALNILLSQHHRTILEFPISIDFLGECVSLCYPDIVLFNNGEKIVLEIKAISKLQLKEYQQIEGYLKHSDMKKGYLINFGNRELEIIKFDNGIQTELTLEDF